MSHPRRALRLVLILLSGALLAQSGMDVLDAASAGDLSRLKALLEAYPDLVDAVEPGIMTALTRACLDGREDCALYLIGKGASLGSLSRGGWFPLNAAVHAGKAGIVSAILDSGRLGAALDQAGANGWTALSMAAAKGDLPMARLLVMRGAAYSSEDGRRDLLMAAASSGRKDVFRWASGLYSEAQMRRLDSRGRSAIHWLAEGNPFTPTTKRGEEEALWVLSFLLKRKLDPALRDAEGRSPEELALASGRKRLAARLK